MVIIPSQGEIVTLELQYFHVWMKPNKRLLIGLLLKFCQIVEMKTSAGDMGVTKDDVDNKNITKQNRSK